MTSPKQNVDSTKETDNVVTEKGHRCTAKETGLVFDAVGASRHYVKTYYTASYSTTFEIQELLRVMQANNWEEDRSVRGWTAIDHVRRLMSNCEEFGVSRDHEFVQFLKTVNDIPQETKTNNVRGIVKKMWTWPLQGFLPWIPISNETMLEHVLKNANEILQSIEPCFKLVEGKVYVMLSGFTKELWKRFPNLGNIIPGLMRPLTPNCETEHITVINSEVVCGHDVLPFLQEFHAPKVEAVNLKHTISLDWARFGICLVVGLKSKHIEDFVARFNEKFNTSARIPNAHITIAIDSRSNSFA